MNIISNINGKDINIINNNLIIGNIIDNNILKNDIKTSFFTKSYNIRNLIKIVTNDNIFIIFGNKDISLVNFKNENTIYDLNTDYIEKNKKYLEHEHIIFTISYEYMLLNKEEDIFGENIEEKIFNLFVNKDNPEMFYVINYLNYLFIKIINKMLKNVPYNPSLDIIDGLLYSFLFIIKL